MAATLYAGQEVALLKQQSVDEIQKGKTYVYVTQLFVGMFEGFILIAIVMTWIYHFNTAKNLVLISLFHMVLPGTFVLSTIVIPIYWRFWTKSREKGGGGAKHGMRLILAYIFLQVINVGASAGSLVWRIVLFNQGCAATLIADECLNVGFRTVEVAFMTIDAAGGLFGIIGFVMGFLIRNYLGAVAGRTTKVKKVFTNKGGEVTGIETAETAEARGGPRTRGQAGIKHRPAAFQAPPLTSSAQMITPPPIPMASSHMNSPPPTPATDAYMTVKFHD